ncbi:transposase-like protein [Enterococcus rotai]
MNKSYIKRIEKQHYLYRTIDVDGLALQKE